MILPRARSLCACAVFALPATVAAQSTRGPTVFSPAAQAGSVSIQATVVLDNNSVVPLSRMPVIVRRNGRADSVSGRTDSEGRLSIRAPAGVYTVYARTPQAIAGRSYSWEVPLVVKTAGSHAVELTIANARLDRVVAVESQPAAATPSSVPPSGRPAGKPAPTGQGTPAERAPATVASPERTKTPERTVVERPLDDRADLPSSIPASATAESKPASAESKPAPVQPPASRPVTQAPPTAPPPAQPTPAVGRSDRWVRPAPPRSNTSGFFVGLNVNGSALQSDHLPNDTESGGGGGAQIGWGLTRNLALFVDGTVARFTTTAGHYDLGHVDAGVRWHFASRARALVPFLEVAFSGRAAMEDNVQLTDDQGNTHQGDLSISGTGFSVGGGLQYFVAPTWALGGSFKWTTGQFSRVQFDKVSVDGFDIDATSARLNFGFTWYPVVPLR